jgi:hypothetical protein
LFGFGIFLDDRYLYRFRLAGHCDIFTAKMFPIHFACDLIESEVMGGYIILFDSFASIERLKFCVYFIFFTPESIYFGAHTLLLVLEGLFSPF